MIIEKRKQYRVKGNSVYFRTKYGTSNPVIEIEDNWDKISGESWRKSQGNPTCILFGMRLGMEGHAGEQKDEDIYYGKIGETGELVMAEELEEV